MVEEKLSQKITVLFSKTMDKKLNEICRKNDRPKSNLIRWVRRSGFFRQPGVVLKWIAVLFHTASRSSGRVLQ